MTKKLTILLILSLMFTLAGCDPQWKYDNAWMIGKTSEQIQGRYGKFDWNQTDAAEDGLYKDCKCFYYLVHNAHEPFTGDPAPDEYLYIVFNENGVAYKVYWQMQQGG